MKTARERAIETLHPVLKAAFHNEEVPRSLAASLVNDLLTAFADETDETLARLADARLEHDAQIRQLVRIAELHNVGQFTDAEVLIEQLKGKHGG